MKANIGKVKGAKSSLRRRLRCRKTKNTGHRSREHSCSCRSLLQGAGSLHGPLNLCDWEIHRDGDLGFSGEFRGVYQNKEHRGTQAMPLWTDVEMELGKCSTLIGYDVESFLLLSILPEMMGRLA